MTRKEFLRRVSERVGQTIPAHVLEHAVRSGKISKPQKVGGWNRYSPEHVERFAAYVRNESRLAMKASEAAL